MPVLVGEQKLLLAPDARSSITGLKIINWTLIIASGSCLVGNVLFDSYKPKWMNNEAWDFGLFGASFLLATAPWVLGLKPAQDRAQAVIEYEQRAAFNAQTGQIDRSYGELVWGSSQQQLEEEESKVGVLPVGRSEPELLAFQLITLLGESFDITVNYSGHSEMPRSWSIELKPGKKVKITSLAGLAEDIKAQMGLVKPPIFVPSKGFISCQIPKEKTMPISFLENVPDKPPAGEGLFAPIGVDGDYKLVTINLRDEEFFSHLICGRTGSGKTIAVMQVLCGLMTWYRPEEVQFCLVDLKGNDYLLFEDCDHLWQELVVEEEGALKTLTNILSEMDRRKKLFAEIKARNYQEFNKKCPDKAVPVLLAILDEISILVNEDAQDDIAKEVTAALKKIAKLGRSFGICPWVITQKPLVSEIPSVIRANLNGRIGLRVNDHNESKIAIGKSDYCEHLLGKGDAYCLGTDGIKRIQTLYLSDEEIAGIINRYSSRVRPSNDNNSEEFVSENNDQKAYQPYDGNPTGTQKSDQRYSEDTEGSTREYLEWIPFLQTLHQLDLEEHLFDSGVLLTENIPKAQVGYPSDLSPILDNLQILPVEAAYLIVSSKRNNISQDTIISLIFGISSGSRGNGGRARRIYASIINKAKDAGYVS